MNRPEQAAMRRVRIEYFDQNEDFAQLLPQSGNVLGAYLDVHGNSDWLLVQLDTPLEYQMKVGEPFTFRLLRVRHFLIRSRWADHPTGGPDPTSVFILLVEESKSTVPDPFNPADYHHVAWGTCTVEA